MGATMSPAGAVGNGEEWQYVMDAALRIVLQAPLTELWDSSGPLDARRTKGLGESDIVRLLQDGSSFVIAEVGKPLKWIPREDRFAFWKTEVKRRLVSPNADRFQLDDYPDNYCYVAAMWERLSDKPIIVLEKSH